MRGNYFALPADEDSGLEQAGKGPERPWKSAVEPELWDLDKQGTRSGL